MTNATVESAAKLADEFDKWQAELTSLLSELAHKDGADGARAEGLGQFLPTLRAAIAALQAEPQGWRPIETAPKDAHALLWIDIAIGQPLVVQGCWFHDDDADEKGWIDLDGNVLNATHWMPLPPLPRTER